MSTIDVRYARRPWNYNVINRTLKFCETAGWKDKNISVKNVLDRAGEFAQSLTNFPSGIHEEGLERLVWGINNEAQLDSLGTYMAFTDLVKWVSSHIELSQAQKFSSLDQINLPEQQLFILSFPRTGSTLLHNLLALDPMSRSPRLWEVLYPTPYPKIQNYESDPRIETTRQWLASLDNIAPLARAIHPMEATLPDECHYLLQGDFTSPIYCLYFNIPSYWKWLTALDENQCEEIFQRYEKYVKYLCYEVTGQRWVSKGAAIHMFFAPVLNKVFPFSNVVRLKRNPEQSIPSLASLITSYRKIYCPNANLNEIGKFSLDLFREAVYRTARNSTSCLSSLIDIEYQDLVDDPINTLKSIYDRFGYEITDSLLVDWRTYLESHGKDKLPRHRYDSDIFGIAPERLKSIVHELRSLNSHLLA